MVEIINDIDLIYDVPKYDIILIATSTMNALGNGFQRKIKISYPWVDKANKKTKYCDKSKLGTCNVSQKVNYPTVILCYIHTGRLRPDIKPDVVDYDSLRNCLNLVNNNFKDKNIGCTILGHSPFEGGGDKEKCLNIIKEELVDNNVYVYDYEQLDYRKENWDILKKNEIARREDKISVDEYFKVKKEIIWRENYGYFEPVPEDISYRKLFNQIKDGKRKNN